jgi:hypothetical protein
VEFLLQAGLSLDVPDNDGQTAKDDMNPAVLAEIERRGLQRCAASCGK